jgi:hypothetical protein
VDQDVSALLKARTNDAVIRYADKLNAHPDVAAAPLTPVEPPGDAQAHFPDPANCGYVVAVTREYFSVSFRG